MKKIVTILAVLGVLAVMVSSCGDEEKGPNGGPAELDTTVIGEWEGAMMALPMFHFNGAKIYVKIARVDSAFSLVTLDPSRDTASNPAIRDTSLVLSGSWRLNGASDSILLVCDTGRIIDTAKNILVPRNVRDSIIPIYISISTNPTTEDIEWIVSLGDFVPLAPLLGMNLSGIDPSVLNMVRIVLLKTKQL